jgi:hypothetical protein
MLLNTRTLISLGAFLDIQGAFDGTSFEMIKQAAEPHGTEPAIGRWICAMLESRNISATLLGETLGAAAARGCPQGSVLSPLLWSPVTDHDLWGPNSNGYYTVGFADDSNRNQREFPSDCVRGLTKSPVHSPTVV